METKFFDDRGRFIIEDYEVQRPFSSFLPGIAGPMGIPMWVFYVNRGQAITSFGVESKDNPIMEFQPANKAYQYTAYTGFRTFIKIHNSEVSKFYEPFSPWSRTEGTRRTMFIGMNELELQETCTEIGLQTNVLYFMIPGESFAGLARQVNLTNLGNEAVEIEMLDGMAAVVPYGLDNWGLKEISRTLEAWMQVTNLDARIPIYRLRASAGDTAEVETFEAGHFALSFISGNGRVKLLPPIVDPVVVFGQNTSLHAPGCFMELPLDELLQQKQISVGRTPCSFFGVSALLKPFEPITLDSVFGHTSSLENINNIREVIANPGFTTKKRLEAEALTYDLTTPIATKTSSPVFDAYCRQTFLDNVLRGGWPILIGGKTKSFVQHAYSRKHGDPERDYNAFFLAAEYYSQGNSNYRDVNQNRRNDVFFNPKVEDFNIDTFMSLIQADGYNPLVVEGSKYSIPEDKLLEVIKRFEKSDGIKQLLSRPFSLGQLVKYLEDSNLSLRTEAFSLLSLVLDNAIQEVTATFGEGYWIDHWTYNLDLIETFLSIYPDKKDELLFGGENLPFFESPAIVRPRSRKYVLADGRPKQVDSVAIDEEKATLINSRKHSQNWMRLDGGEEEIYRTTLFNKLVILALVKFSTMDPLGMGIEMEAGKPSWYDAMNGLPSLFGASMPETYELLGLLRFLQDALEKKLDFAIKLPDEVFRLLESLVTQLRHYYQSDHPERDFFYWDSVSTARETYRNKIRLGFGGASQSIGKGELKEVFNLFVSKIKAGIARANDITGGVPPTYFAYEVEKYEIIRDGNGNRLQDEQKRPFIRVKQFRPVVLPSFLEGPVRALKVSNSQKSARHLYKKVRESDLYDEKLGMYKVNASLESQPHDIGRARAFTPGWLENESIWLHMEYKYLLEVLKSGLYPEFFEDFKSALVPFQNPSVYGRSTLENVSFIVSSVHPDESIHGMGYVARLSGSTAEFLSIWNIMMTGKNPFFLRNGSLCLAFRPILPGWLFGKAGNITFTFLGGTKVVYENPQRRDTFIQYDQVFYPTKVLLKDGRTIMFPDGVIGAPYAEMIREGEGDQIDTYIERPK